MRSHQIPALAVVLAGAALTAPALTAQYKGEPPTQLATVVKEPKLGSTAVGGNVAAIDMVPTSAPNVYFCVMTVIGYPGGGGSYDIVTGEYDTSTKTYTDHKGKYVPLTGSFNSSGAEFAGTITPDLLHISFDTPSAHPIGGGTIVWASRPNTTVAFSTPKKVNGAPGGYIDPRFGMLNGTLGLFYIAGSDLSWAPFNTTTGTLDVANARTVVTNPIGGGSHSPAPIEDKAGDFRAVSFSARVPGRQSNSWLAPSTNDGHTSYEIHDTSSWQANPDANGGLLHYADAPSGYTDPLRIEVTCCAGDTVARTGGQVVLTAWVPISENVANPRIFTGGILLGTPGQSGFDISVLGPNFTGALSFDLTQPIVALPGQPYDFASGALQYSFTTPALAQSLTLWIQNYALEVTTAKFTLGNTASLVVQ